VMSLMRELLRRMETRGVENRTNPIEKPQKTAFGSDVIGSFSYSTAWFSLVCGFHFTNRTKPQHKKNINYTYVT